MQDDFHSQAQARIPERRGARTRVLIGAMITAFLLGVALTGYFAWHGDLHFLGSKNARPAAAPLALAAPSASPADAGAAAQAAALAQQQGGLEARVVAMEQRLDSLSLQSQAVAGNAARAEGLLIAYAARRSIERGAKLDDLAGQLKLRFGDAQPNAVRTVIQSADHPVTLDVLIARLDGLAPKLSSAAQEEVSWNWFKRQLGSLFVVRRDTSPSPQPEKRLERARLFLETGRIRAAVEEVRNLPGADSSDAQLWIADAGHYADAEDALDLLEKTALLDENNLRDGQGNRVQQPSPAKTPSP